MANILCRLGSSLLLVACVPFVTPKMAAASAAPASAEPETMLRMVVRVMGPSIKPGSFAALPKTIFRAGPHFARIEDPPDARQQIQKLTIIAEPDGYSVNLIDKKGMHYTDQGGGENDLHLPIVLPFDPKHQLGPLDRIEFGDEYDFFEDAGARPEPGPTINATPTDALRLSLPKGSALLVLRSGTHNPITLSWTMPDGTYKYEYIEYGEKPFNRSLFTKPAGIVYREIQPDTVGEH